MDIRKLLETRLTDDGFRLIDVIGLFLLIVLLATQVPK